LPSLKRYSGTETRLSWKDTKWLCTH